jgi:tetratricopeptide (TPR) repeat protein
VQCFVFLAWGLLVFPAISSAEAEPGGSARGAVELTEAAFVYLHQGDAREEGWEEAYQAGIAAAEQAIELAPENANAHYALFCNLGRRLERSGPLSQAFSVRRLHTLLERTVELDPSHAHAWSALGEMLLRLPWLLGGSEKDGLAALHHAAELDPGWYKPHLRLAEYFLSDGKAEQARQEARVAKKLAMLAGESEAVAQASRILGERSD